MPSVDGFSQDGVPLMRLYEHITEALSPLSDRRLEPREVDLLQRPRRHAIIDRRRSQRNAEAPDLLIVSGVVLGLGHHPGALDAADLRSDER